MHGELWDFADSVFSNHAVVTLLRAKRIIDYATFARNNFFNIIQRSTEKFSHSHSVIYVLKKSRENEYKKVRMAICWNLCVPSKLQVKKAGRNNLRVCYHLHLLRTWPRRNGRSKK